MPADLQPHHKASHQSTVMTGHTITRRPLHLAIVCWLALPLAATLATEPSPDSLLDALASPSHETREQASQTLLNSNQLTVNTLRSMFARAKSPEQRHRLIRAAEHRLLSDLRRSIGNGNGEGALGVTHRSIRRGQLPELKRAAIMILDTLPGFPAHGKLKPGDLIISIGDEPIPANYTANQVSLRFVKIVRKHKADQVIQLNILRDTRKIAVEIRLANLSALSEMYSPKQIILSRQYQDQINKMISDFMALAPGPAVIEVRSEE